MSRRAVPFYKSLSGRVLLLGGLPSALILTAIVFNLTFEMFTLAKQNTESLLRNITGKVALEVERGNTRAVLATQIMSLSQQHGLYGERINSNALARRVLAEFPEFTGAYFGYEPNADQDDNAFLASPDGHAISGGVDVNGRFLPYWFRASGTDDLLLLNPLIDMESSLYYQGAKELMQQAGKPLPMVTEPYLYEGKMIVEQTYPIVINGSFKGIAGVDRALNDIDHFLKGIKQREGVDIFLISRSGRFLATTTDEAELPLKTKAIQDTPYQQLFGELYRDRNNPTYLLAEDPFDNKNYYYSSAVVDTGQWMVVVRKSEQGIGTPIWQQLLLSLVTIATALLVFLFIGVAMARSLSHHIHRAKEAADLLASGALPEKLALDTTTHDEIGHMNRSINKVLKEHRAITQACRALATGDYSYRLEPRSEQDQLAGAINQIGEHILRKEAQSRARSPATDNGSKPTF